MFGNRRHFGHRGNNAQLIWLLLYLWGQISAMPNKPPVTLGLIGLQIYAFMMGYGPNVSSFFSSWTTSAGSDDCLSAAKVLNAGLLAPSSIRRILLSPFLHADDYHLYYNMTSFLWKGYQLEQLYGSEHFALVIGALAMLTQAIYLALAVVADAVLGWGWSNECAVGFSGVLFALKMILNIDSSGNTYLYGISVPTKHAAWAELILIHLLVPNASFVGHLAGIIAGLLFVYVERKLTWQGALRQNATILGVLRSFLFGDDGTAGAAGFGWRAGGGGAGAGQPQPPQQQPPRPGSFWGTGTWGQPAAAAAGQQGQPRQRPSYQQPAQQQQQRYAGGAGGGGASVYDEQIPPRPRPPQVPGWPGHARHVD